MLAKPTIIEQPSVAVVEATKAKLWRKNVVKLTRAQLGERIGYSVQAVQLFERGYGFDGRVLGERSRRRFRLACAGLHVPDFDWNTRV